jgi:hypothetical protein
MKQHNPDRYTKGTRVRPSKKAVAQAIGGKIGTVTSRWPLFQIVTIKWDDKRSNERWHVNLLALANEQEGK